MTKKISYTIFSIIGVLFVFFCVAEYKLAADGNIIWNGSWIIKILGISLAAGVVLGSLLCFLLLKIEEKCMTGSVRPHRKLPAPGIVCGISWLLTMISWLPGYLAYYPGIATYDFLIQLGQIQSGAYNEHHPIMHTLLMGMFIRLGDYFGNGTAGLAAYTFVQMAVIALALACGVAMLRKWEVRTRWIICLQVCGCLFPFHWYMSISTTKDTLFTAFVLLFLLMLCEQIGRKDKEVSFRMGDAGFVLFAVLMILFRNNAIYAMLVLAVFLIVAVIFNRDARKKWIKLLAEVVLGMVIGSAVVSLLFSATNAVQGDKREMLSMPIQQLARTMVYHGGIDVVPEDDNTMSEEDKALINDFIRNEGYRNYRAAISDPVKTHTYTYVFVYRMKDFMKTYLGLFLEYPGDYLNAVLAVNAGYLSPFDESHAYINVNGRDTGLGYIQTRWLDPDPNDFELSRESKWPWMLKKMETFADGNVYLNIPILKYVCVPGTYLWLLLILMAWLLIHKRFDLLLPYTLLLGYYVTLFLGPTVQLRYIYPVMTVLPYLTVWSLNIIRKDRIEKRSVA